MPDDAVLLNDWYVVAQSRDVYPGKVLGARVLERNLVLWRSEQGSVQVWKDQCPHRGARLSLGAIDSADDTLMCPYHGWRFDAQGRCVRFPAHPGFTPPGRARVERYAARERYGYVWMCLDEAANDLPALAEFDDPAFRIVRCGPYRYQASAPRAVENFLDLAHLPYVHKGYLGAEPYTEVPDYDVETSAHGIVARNCRSSQPNNNLVKTGSEITYTYHVLRPLAAYLTKDAQAGDPKREGIALFVTPVEEFVSLGWIALALNYDHHLPDEKFRAFQDMITLQDLPIVESQTPKRLPLTPHDECHQRADKLCQAYRRWLKDKGLRYGVTLDAAAETR